jgi:hypothetical protein
MESFVKRVLHIDSLPPYFISAAFGVMILPCLYIAVPWCFSPLCTQLQYGVDIYDCLYIPESRGRV